LDSIKSSAESGQAVAKGINNANNAAHQENVEYRQRQQEDYNKWLNAVETATALYGATAQGMEWLSKVPRLSTSVATNLGNVASKLKEYAPASQTVGMAVDGIQLYNSNNTFDTIDNSVEIGLEGLGFAGATDIFRKTSLYGKYGKAIDNAFDISGFVQNNWDIFKNTIGEGFVENWKNKLNIKIDE
jgi:hypothetical protein